MAEDINKICDYIIFRLKAEDNVDLSNLKLQKLLYYTQAWHLAFNNEPLFEGKFQAWIHGPVNRQIFDRFKISKTLYSSIELSDLKSTESMTSLSSTTKEHIHKVLEVYGHHSGVVLEGQTHNETPWISARIGYDPMDRCEVEIDEEIMKRFYRNKLPQQ